ncbi:hypothetical protein NDR87_26480 [Nocardia sp. CDC159]|uniref:Phage portal protein n=1 Tax=Nocardia pulmonis TaxID=2951408 RepID=A0A9X2E7G2_9NOCA|nr:MULTISPECIES: hypothetical protein [Nocardia]MCM6774995.1 hypothetical protein [Nocardia pulmonis]MCM6789926.1 hypothetical protein [Nocardia sp. CDC159]
MARIFARRKPAVTAAVQPVRDPVKTFRSTLGVESQSWQTRGWEMYEKCGELRYICKWIYGSLTQCRLVASEIDQETGRPTGETTNAQANRIVRDIAGGPTGMAQLLGRTGVFLTVPGEGFVAVIVRPQGREEQMEEWHLLDRSEITTRGTGEIVLTLDDGTKHLFRPEVDVLFRVWQPHPKRAQDADSPVRSALGALAEIVQTTATIHHAGKSRLIGNKILMLPTEMSLPKAMPAPTAAPVDPDAPTLPPAPAPQVQASAQDLQDLLFEVAQAATENPDSAAAYLPIVCTVAGDFTDKAKVIDLHSDVNAEQLKIREAAIRRLALSMDIPAEVLLGLSDMNHWNAWAMQEDTVKTHVVPLLEIIADAVTTALFRPVLEREGLDPDRFVVWYDITQLTQDPDKKDEAFNANERGALSHPSLLKHLGFTEEDGYDLDTVEGWQQFARDTVARKPELLPSLAPLLGVALPEIPEVPAPATPGPQREIEGPREQEPPEPANVEASAEPARAMASLLLVRALELAGKRRCTRADQARYPELPPWQVHTRMPPVTSPAETRRLIAGWDAGFTADMAAAVGADPERLRTLVIDRASQALMSTGHASIGARDALAVLR